MRAGERAVGRARLGLETGASARPARARLGAGAIEADFYARAVSRDLSFLSRTSSRTGLVAYMIMQSGLSCRVPKTPRTPRSTAQHFFGEDIATPSERGDESAGPFSAYAASEATLGDLSPDAL